ncbi:MAG: hypothetical protein IKL74_01995 [Clostridia bacterium]|nr:hypothetical protein [Clostridia bacterium]
MSIYKMNVEIMKKKLENSIGIDDRFETSCKNCNGYCKKSNVTIILNPYDIYRVSKELNVKVPDFLNNYCTISPGYQTKLPVVQLNRTVKGKCILLRNGICKAEKGKPLACSLYPLDIFMDNNIESTKFFVNRVNGHGTPVTYTVRQWLDMNKIDLTDRFYSLWGELVDNASPLRREMLEYEGFERTIQLENQIIIHLLYGAYDTDKDFFTQFVKNSEELIEYLSTMLDVCRNCCIKKDEY